MSRSRFRFAIALLAGALVFGAQVLTNRARAAGPQSNDDSTIVSDIQAKLFDDSLLKTRDIRVTSQDGVVTLLGTVNTDLEKAAVDRIASHEPGVKKVVDGLTVTAKANQDASSREAAVNAQREAAQLANPSAWVTMRVGERLPDQDLARILAHNRALCDQAITVAGLTPNGLALYVPPLGQKFMAKNSQNYPRMCLLEDATSVVPGVPRYLLVYAYSENAFAGFQPVTRINTTTTSVSGSGRGRNTYGDAWNFTYYGTAETTEMVTIEAPYVIQSHSLYLNAYDENGNIVSRHSVTVSSQTGGNGARAAGYNAAQLIALLWNNPSHLIKSVLKDVQKDSKKYSTN